MVGMVSQLSIAVVCLNLVLKHVLITYLPK